MTRIALSAGLVSLAAGLAAAATLTTPPVIHQTGEVLTCVAVNVGSQDRMMKADVLEFFNSSPLDSEQDDAAPGGAVSASGDGNYCRFTVQKKNDTRAAAHVTDGSGNTLAVIPAE